VRLTASHKLAIVCTLIAIPMTFMAWSKVRARNDDETLERIAQLQAKVQRLQDQQHAIRLHELFADGQPAAPGLLFAGLVLGEAWAVDPDLKQRITAFTIDAGADVTVERDEIRITIPPPPSSASIDEVRAAARRAWGPGDGDRWRNPDAHLRAAITTDASGRTTVRFQRTMSAAELFPPDGRASIWFSPVGAPTYHALPLGGRMEPTASGYAYELPAIGWSEDRVRVTIEVDPQDVVTAVHLRTGARTVAQLREVGDALRARYGEPRPLPGGASASTWRDDELAITATVLAGGMVVDLTRSR
jgi:hypothetical protein